MNSIIDTKYRPDIDGLRAVAVLMVVIYHFKQNLGFNGYMGVDVFFVISGYLITGILYQDSLQNRFSIKTFYERRVRRILPALLAVITAVTFFATPLFLPDELKLFAKSAIASLFFSSNILFYSEADYFDASGDLKPLLHTWSLSVEEQFYILFPLIIWALVKWIPKSIKLAIVTLFLVSFFSSLLGQKIVGDVSLPFYMFPLRAWELLAGSLLAIGVFPAGKLSYKVQKFMSWLGFGLIVVGVAFNFDNTIPYCLQVLPVVVGTAMLIYVGQESRHIAFNKVLGCRGFLFIGKISYSLYLWHWPIYVFAKYLNFGDLSNVERGVLLPLSVFVSYLSWKYIEQPFRNGKYRDVFSRKIALSGGLVVAVLLIVNSASLYANGKTIFYSSEIYKIIDAKLGVEMSPVELRNNTSGGIVLGKVFGANGRADQAEVLLIGDSHAVAISPAIDSEARELGATALMMDNWCLINSQFVREVSGKDKALYECSKLTDSQFDYIANNKSFKLIVIAQRWMERTEDFHRVYSMPFSDYLDVREKSLLSLVQRIQADGRLIVFLGEVPLIKSKEQNIPSQYGRMMKLYPQGVEGFRPLVAEYLATQRNMANIFMGLEERAGVKVLWPHLGLCDRDICNIADENGIYYWDDDHLSQHGAKHIKSLFTPYFRQALMP